MMLSRAMRGIRQSPGLFVTTSVSVAVSLLLVGAFVVALDGARAWLERVVGAETLVVYLRPDVDDAKSAAIAEEIGKKDEVASVERESPQQSAERLRAVLDDDARASVTGALGWSLQVRAKKAGELQLLAATLSSVPGVDEVDYGEGLYERLQAMERIVTLGSAVLFALVLAVCAYVVSITISLALYVRREEIAVQKIVGASDSFIIVPLLVEGALSGLGGALASSAVLSLGSMWAQSRFQVAFASLGIDNAGVPLDFVGMQIVLGVATCTIGAFVAALRYLRQTE